MQNLISELSYQSIFISRKESQEKHCFKDLKHVLQCDILLLFLHTHTLYRHVTCVSEHMLWQEVVQSCIQDASLFVPIITCPYRCFPPFHSLCEGVISFLFADPDLKLQTACFKGLDICSASCKLLKHNGKRISVMVFILVSVLYHYTVTQQVVPSMNKGYLWKKV